MIPLRLHLRNFMSYGDETATLDFEALAGHVACLSGDNGNGKSALLDAMTYALWGKTRASGSQASGEDDLVRLGAEEMEVSFEFRLGHEVYRATRRRSRRARAGDWTLDLRDEASGWTAIAGGGMAGVGRQIGGLVRMEYETFLNSAYIQQGRADEFTRQKPMDRKRILADILNLSRYDRLEEMARDRRADFELILKDLEGEIRHLSTRAAEEPAHRDRLVALELQVANLTAERDTCEAEARAARKRAAELEERSRRLNDREERLREVEAEAAEVDARIAALRTQRDDAAALIAERETILTDVERLRALRAELEELDSSVRELASEKQLRSDLSHAIEQERLKLLRALDRADSDCQAVRERDRLIADLGQRIGDVLPKLAQLAAASAELAEVRTRRAEAQERFADLSGKSKKLKADIAEVEEVLALLGGADSACPVCNSSLAGGRRRTVEENQRRRLHDLQNQLTAVNQDGLTCKREREALDSRAENVEARLRGEAALNAQRVEWERLRAEALLENSSRDAVVQAARELRDQFKNDSFAAAERVRLAEIDVHIAGLERRVLARGEAETAVRDLVMRGAERRAAALDVAERTLAEIVQALDRDTALRDRRKQQIAAERSRVEALRSEIAELDSARHLAAQAEQKLRTAALAREQALATAERERAAVDDCAKSAVELGRKRVESERAARDKQCYSDLAAAFGKKGVQALIIDNALPEIEDEANRLLGRLTDSAMRVGLSTLRQARSGGSQIETLDISITDEAGTRPYEMYSGGEAFRVNFALRIALSRLLARRAGARLQTLILDEGFGTQDAKGRERLVEAIEAVKDEFALILVISHIEELKDAFPVRIEVAKGAEGSVLTVVQ